MPRCPRRKLPVASPAGSPASTTRVLSTLFGPRAERLFPVFCCPHSSALCSVPLSCEHLIRVLWCRGPAGCPFAQALAGLEMTCSEGEAQGPGSLA